MKKCVLNQDRSIVVSVLTVFVGLHHSYEVLVLGEGDQDLNVEVGLRFLVFLVGDLLACLHEVCLINTQFLQDS